jgi:hypothetical protein
MLQPYQGNFVKRHLSEFIKAIDDFLKMSGKLVTHYKVAEQYPNLDESQVVKFE